MSARGLVRRLFVGTFLAGLFSIVFGLSAALATWFFLKGEVQGKVVAVPDLFGKTEREARDLCRSAGLNLIVDASQQVHSQVVDQGLVLLQVPRSGKNIKSGRNVEITLSAGPKKVLVPGMTGETLTFSKELLASAGMEAQVITRSPSQLYAKGRVIAQEPEAGQELGIRQGTSLLVSDGPQYPWHVMPKLEGKDYLTVKAFLDEHDFRVITRYRENDEDLGQIVLEQIPLAGYPVNRSQTITLVVNKDF